MRPTRDQWAMELAQVTAKRSTCCRRSVGCVLLNERGHVLATGYNGRAAGLPHCNEITDYVDNHALLQHDGLYRTPEHWERRVLPVFGNACSGAGSLSGTNLDACEAIHAEQNALLQCKNVYEIHSCYVTTSPCVTCLKLLLNTSCQIIHYLDKYADFQTTSKIWVSARRELRAAAENKK